VNRELEEIADSVQRLHEASIAPLEHRFAYQAGPTPGEIGGGPLAILLGNHSSGKSTFINHLLGQQLQSTGMAPTDDRFTIIRYGPAREERDGAAVVSNRELPFGSLQAFGPELLSHLRMRSLPHDLLREVTLVDTPGMIDSAGSPAGRSYDFFGVTRWFAERADLVLVFFDPERPGTTAETLTALTSSLSGIDHKLLVVMNKMDQSRSLRDFARCFGTLCWNLGKTLQKKDMPQIFTTYVPVEGAPEAALPLDDFDKAREELIAEIRRAPFRRVDNMISLATAHGEGLRLHARVADRAGQKLRATRWKFRLAALLVALLGLGAGGYALYLQEWWTGAIIIAVALLLAFTVRYIGQRVISSRERRAAETLDETFEEVHRRDLVVGDRPTSLLKLWERTRPITRRAAAELGLLSLPRLKNGELAKLNRCLEEELPALRAKLHRPESLATRNEAGSHRPEREPSAAEGTLHSVERP
jgi:hypothetical protein